MNRFVKRIGGKTARLVLLAVIIAASGIGLGLAAGYPLSRVQFEASDAIRLDQAGLAGEVDETQAIVTADDLAAGWESGDEGLASFSVLGAEMCGEDIPLPEAASKRQVAVFANPSDDSFLITDAVRVARWQFARDYVNDVGDALESCDQFYRTSFEGERVLVDVESGMGDPAITDQVSRTFVSQEGASVQVWSIMAIGDVIVGIQYLGPDRPQQNLMSDLEDKLLLRLDPADFAPGGLAGDSSTTLPGGATATTLEGGVPDGEPGADLPEATVPESSDDTPD